MDARWRRDQDQDHSAGSIAVGAISPAQLTADTNDYAPANITLATTLRLSTDASRNITGLVDAREGAIKSIINVGNNPLVLQNQNAGSAAANRFDFGADITLASKQSATIRYDGTDQRWKLIAQTAGSAVADGAVTARTLGGSALSSGLGMVNGTLSETHAGNSVTFSVKSRTGTDPTPADPVHVVFQNGTGAYVIRSITAALSLTISAGSSLGVGSGTAFRVWLILIDTGSGVVIGAVNCLSGTNIFPLLEGYPTQYC